MQFLDADDWITPNATRLLVQSVEQNECDMVISDFYRVISAITKTNTLDIILK